jgi:peptide subunit release factor 1 (eRF1)
VVSEPLNRRVDARARRYDLLTVADLKALAAFHSDVDPVVSLYLDVRPEERQGDKVRAKLKHLIDEAKRLPATRRVEAERVAALLDAALGHGPGVLGLESTLEAIVEQRVQILVTEEDFRQPGFECPHCQYLVATSTAHCPLCDTALDPQLDIVERAVERAIDQ